jgi:hypothetical protein
MHVAADRLTAGYRKIRRSVGLVRQHHRPNSIMMMPMTKVSSHNLLCQLYESLMLSVLHLPTLPSRAFSRWYKARGWVDVPYDIRYERFQLS